MGMYVCGPCMAEHDLESPATGNNLAVHLLLGGGDVVGSCEVCGPLRGDWSEKRLRWTDRITRSIDATDRRAHVLAELAAYKAWKAGGCVGKY